MSNPTMKENTMSIEILDSLYEEHRKGAATSVEVFQYNEAFRPEDWETTVAALRNTPSVFDRDRALWACADKSEAWAVAIALDAAGLKVVRKDATEEP